ncbi:hypothetical protein MKZ38_002214 [Zalerion maritima]|uniref:Uncharacterized protein n=1 Tax=Zalerion maritima TaxID=339359 RepID=A0AAD5RVY5_9PEZI|nr:hypothetical protein MKZ38_002214 [Zalerion maritima]
MTQPTRVALLPCNLENASDACQGRRLYPSAVPSCIPSIPIQCSPRWKAHSTLLLQTTWEAPSDGKFRKYLITWASTGNGLQEYHPTTKRRPALDGLFLPDASRDHPKNPKNPKTASKGIPKTWGIAACAL